MNGVSADDRAQNWRRGGTRSKALNRHNSIKRYDGRGAVVRAGQDFQTSGLTWQPQWSAGR